MIDRREVVGWLEIARSFIGLACLLAALLGFASAVLSGVHVATLLLVPPPPRHGCAAATPPAPSVPPGSATGCWRCSRSATPAVT